MEQRSGEQQHQQHEDCEKPENQHRAPRSLYVVTRGILISKNLQSPCNQVCGNSPSYDMNLMYNHQETLRRAGLRLIIIEESIKAIARVTQHCRLGECISQRDQDRTISIRYLLEAAQSGHDRYVFQPLFTINRKEMDKMQNFGL